MRKKEGEAGQERGVRRWEVFLTRQKSEIINVKVAIDPEEKSSGGNLRERDKDGKRGGWDINIGKGRPERKRKPRRSKSTRSKK